MFEKLKNSHLIPQTTTLSNIFFGDRDSSLSLSYKRNFDGGRYVILSLGNNTHKDYIEKPIAYESFYTLLDKNLPSKVGFNTIKEELEEMEKKGFNIYKIVSHAFLGLSNELAEEDRYFTYFSPLRLQNIAIKTVEELDMFIKNVRFSVTRTFYILEKSDNFSRTSYSISYKDNKPILNLLTEEKLRRIEHFDVCVNSLKDNVYIEDTNTRQVMKSFYMNKFNPEADNYPFLFDSCSSIIDFVRHQKYFSKHRIPYDEIDKQVSYTAMNVLIRETLERLRIEDIERERRGILATED